MLTHVTYNLHTMESKQKYELKYPCNLSPTIRMIVTQKGDLFSDPEGKVLEVKQVVQPPLGALPELLLQIKS